MDLRVGAAAVPNDCAAPPGLCWDMVDHPRRGRLDVRRARLTATVWALRIAGDLRPGQAAVVAKVSRPILLGDASLIIDLRDVTYLGPRGVSALAEIHRLAVSRRRSMVVVARIEQQAVRRPLFDAGLLDVLRLARSLAEAFRAIRDAASSDRA